MSQTHVPCVLLPVARGRNVWNFSNWACGDSNLVPGPSCLHFIFSRGWQGYRWWQSVVLGGPGGASDLYTSVSLPASSSDIFLFAPSPPSLPSPPLTPSRPPAPALTIHYSPRPSLSPPGDLTQISARLTPGNVLYQSLWKVRPVRGAGWGDLTLVRY